MSNHLKILFMIFFWYAFLSSNTISAAINHFNRNNVVGNNYENRASKSFEYDSEKINLERKIKSIENYLLVNPDWKNEAWLLRADLYSSTGNYSPAKSIDLYNNGVQSSKKKQFGKAIIYYKKSMELDPFFPWPANNLAWEHATCPDPKIRDGKKAVAYARIAIESTHTPVADYFGTLAAAYATKGDYHMAVYFCKEAQKIFPTANRKIMLKKFLSKNNFIDYSDPPVNCDTTYSKGFGETKWGMTKLYVLSLYPDAKLSNNDLLILSGVEIAGFNARVELHFFNDMLYKAVIYLEKDKISADQKKYLENYLIKEYGHPDMITDDNEFNWKTNDITIKYSFIQQSSAVNIILTNKKISMIIAERDEYRNSQ